MECCPFHPPGDLRGNSYTPCDRGHQRRTVFLVDAKKLLLEGFGEEEEGPPRRVLLLGEGNFSFAAALCEAGGTHVVATCYESEEEVSRRGRAAQSIRRLRERGAEVVFSVDCTKMTDYFSPEKRGFHRIYFNFPHCGRKSGVVKNRDLLARFFHSSAEMLTEEGEIHVALCNGQGGTPADQPRREWHNSWQIVAVAAGAGFILSNIHPFKAETIPGYKCTGYRSQDKSFRVEGALNHIFTRSTPLLPPKPVTCETQLESRKVYFQVPQVLVDKIDRGFLELNSCHPVRTVSGETVISIQLIDSFQHAETGRKSLCYRLTFQSCDEALSHQEAAEMQLLFRKEIEQRLRVTLR
ncbi:ferredoxin-fold anticodon binding domain containing 1 [Columba livia]|uniref:Ferredoxin-fold anticodon binding domain containing 1 n=1 Tax=Columba livia TaxID=8932 RepID=A0A2I0LVB5_COLLI|nr:ferredoxin-fold anticodon binding domain containing 1 [Columba livia]